MFCVYLSLLQYVMKPGFSSNLFHKLFGESRKWEKGSPQGILRDLTQEEGLVLEEIRSLVQPHRWQKEEGNNVDI